MIHRIVGIMLGVMFIATAAVFVLLMAVILFNLWEVLL